MHRAARDLLAHAPEIFSGPQGDLDGRQSAHRQAPHRRSVPHELRVNTNDQEMFIRFKTGATWQVLGSDRYDAAVGSPPAGITFSEWALSNPAAWADPHPS